MATTYQYNLYRFYRAHVEKLIYGQGYIQKDHAFRCGKVFRG